METNRLRPEDKVEVMLVHSDGRQEKYEGTGFRDIKYNPQNEAFAENQTKRFRT